MSPRACLMASAASSRSYSEPSVMTRSTREAELLGDLRQRDFGNVAIAAALMRQQAMGVLDGAFASLDGDIHASASLRDEPRRARESRQWHRHATSTTSMPRGNSAALTASRSNRSAGWIAACKIAVPSMPGPRSSNAGPCVQAFDLQDQRRRTIRIFIAAERKAIEIGQRAGIADQRETADRGIRDHRRAGVEFEPFATSDVSDIASVEPDRRVVIEQCQRDGGGAAHHARQARRRRPRCAATLPGRAIASITERKVDCADNTLSANPAGSSAIVVIAQPSPRTSV